MIFGIGTDIVQLSRMESTYERFGDAFARRVLLDAEYALFTRAKRPVRFLAMRFARVNSAYSASSSTRRAKASPKRS